MRLQCSTKHYATNKTIAFEVFNVGFDPTSLYVHEEGVQCWVCLTNPTLTPKVFNAGFNPLPNKPALAFQVSMLGSIPHHHTCWSLVKKCPHSKEHPASLMLNHTRLLKAKCWVQFLSLHVNFKERCPMLALHDKPTLTPKVSMLASMLTTKTNQQ